MQSGKKIAREIVAAALLLVSVFGVTACANPAAQEPVKKQSSAAKHKSKAEKSGTEKAPTAAETQQVTRWEDLAGTWCNDSSCIVFSEDVTRAYFNGGPALQVQQLQNYGGCKMLLVSPLDGDGGAGNYLACGKNVPSPGEVEGGPIGEGDVTKERLFPIPQNLVDPSNIHPLYRQEPRN